jgi:probable phosphoglycerate mutase
VQIDDGLKEVDFGEWTGLTFDVLNARMEWQRFNSSRSVAEVPGGETASAVQQRIVAVLDRLAARHRGGVFAVVSHLDVIRAAILHVMRTSLDDVHMLTIDPASVSAVELEPPRVLYLNRDVVDVTRLPLSAVGSANTRAIHGGKTARLERHLHRP